MGLQNEKKISSLWQTINLEKLLSKAAQTISPGNATDAGKMWRLPTDHPNPILLASGIPDTSTLPSKELLEGFTRALNEAPSDSLSYGGWFGDEQCRKSISKRQALIEKVVLNEDNIILHNGSSACLENILKTFIEPDDVVIVESPSYSGTVRCIQGYLADVIELPITDNGVNHTDFTSLVEKIKNNGKNIKMFYTIPDYHNPTGIVTNINTRKAILKTCEEHNIIIVEDAAYTELYFDSPPPPSYFFLSQGYGVIKMSSFSKIIATGLRVGWIQARHEYIEVLTKVRFDMGNSPLLHYAITSFIENGGLDKHVSQMRNLYKEKCLALLNSINEFCDPYIDVNPPSGGYFLWVNCKKHKAFKVLEEASKVGLIFPIGSVFYVDKNLDDSHFRLAFTQPTFKDLRETGKRLKLTFERLSIN